MTTCQLTDYERLQIQKIAGWKAEPPSYFSAFLETITRPLVKAAEHVILPDVIGKAVDNAYIASEMQSHQNQVAKRAKVNCTTELLSKDLDFCNKLADVLAWESAEKAMFWGSAASGPNIVSTLISLNTLMTNCLKTIHIIGYCYGFTTHEEHERAYVLGVLLIACACTVKQKQEAVVTLGNVQDMIFEEAFEDLLQDVILDEVVTAVGVSSLPLVGMLTGAMHSAALTEHAAAVAKYCFIERWLRRNHKIDNIPADRKFSRSIFDRSRARMENNAYWGAFGTSFLVCVPFAWLISWIPRKNPAARGIADGRRNATADAIKAVETIKGGARTAPVEESLIDAATV